MRSKVLLRMSLIVGKMQDPQPQAGGVRIRIAFSGINPGDVKKREDAFGLGMPYPRVGYGVMVLNPTVLSEPPPSTPSFLSDRSFKSPRACRWSRVHVSAFPASPLIALFMSQVQSQDEPS